MIISMSPSLPASTPERIQKHYVGICRLYNTENLRRLELQSHYCPDRVKQARNISLRIADFDNHSAASRILYRFFESWIPACTEKGQTDENGVVPGGEVRPPPAGRERQVAGVCRREPPDCHQRLCGGDLGSTGGGESGEGEETGLLSYPQRLALRPDTEELMDMEEDMEEDIRSTEQAADQILQTGDKEAEGSRPRKQWPF
jgi:hypothetical protein